MNIRRSHRQALLWISSACACLAPGARASALPLDAARISEVVKTVEVRSELTHRKKNARVNDAFGVPDVMSTGAGSRAEMVASDGTVTRVGANTVFSFSSGKREVSLEKGTVLFHSPTGRGGGQIRTSSATAGVMGTSIIVSATKNGGFKLLVLEGKAKATLPDGKSVSVGAGQLTFVLPGSRAFGPTINFRLSEQVKGSKLVNGFKSPIASLDKITAATVEQEKKIASGKIEATDLQITDTLVTTSSDADTSLQQVRSQIAEKKASTLETALARDTTILNGIAEKSQVFIYQGPSVPQALLNLLGADGASSVSRDVGYDYLFYVGNKISVLGSQQKWDLSKEGSAYDYVFAAKDAFIVNEGRASNDPSLLNPRTTMDNLLSAQSSEDVSLWVVAGREISITNTLVDHKSSFLTLGNWYDAYPDISVELKNSVVLNGLDKMSNFGGMMFPDKGDVYIGARSVKSTDSSIITTGNIQIKANTIDVTSSGAAWSEYLAGYRSNYNTNGPSSPSTLKMTATDQLSVKGANIGAYNVSMDARTVVLQDVDFNSNSTVTLKSGLGQLAPNPNTGQPATARMVNYISNVTYGGQPAQNYTAGYQPNGVTAPVKITISANGR